MPVPVYPAVHAVVGLPRDTFKGTGTTAKTAILYLEKRKAPEGHQVLLAEIGRLYPNSEPNPELEAAVAALRKRHGREDAAHTRRFSG